MSEDSTTRIALDKIRGNPVGSIHVSITTLIAIASPFILWWISSMATSRGREIEEGEAKREKLELVVSKLEDRIRAIEIEQAKRDK